ncbi:hypothetical protein TRAPUB_999 [Trametes pubescens]|uniref:Uncharacterized protein n=1 Tax=Trametes pubescens TaxID=154538 RepID=A0A1M2VKD0_TRAPU|nr:hypothetical protein TRAPUB_999 [Trametes pubescens]
MDDDQASSTHVFSQSCPHDGCAYVAKSTSKASVEHNLGSHTSNLHAQRTKVWSGATQVTILRDLKTKMMSCPCGSYSHLNAALVRKHALRCHKGSDKVPRGSSPAASSSVAELSAPSSPGPADPVLPARKMSSHRSTASAKTRTPGDELPVSSWRERLLSSMKKPSDSQDKNAGPSRRLSAPFAPVARPISQALKRAREEELEPSPPSKAPRLDGMRPMTRVKELSQPSQVAVKSGRQPKIRTSNVNLEEVETRAFDSEEDEPAPGQPEVKPPTSSERTCSVCSKAVMCSLKYWKNQPEFMCSKCILKGAAAAKAKVAVSSNAEPSTSGSPAVVPSPASAAPRPKPRPRPRVKRNDAAPTPAPTEAKQPVSTEQPTVSLADPPAPLRRAVVDPPSPVAGTSSEPSRPAHPFEAPSDSEAERPQAAPEKPRRRRVSKKMRAGAFRGWFDGVLADLRAKHAVPVGVDRGEYPKVQLIEQQGGTAYTTQEEFLAALRRCVSAFERGRAEGRRERLAFRAGYSIVAQPKIRHKERGESVMRLLRAMGLELAEAGLQDVTFHSRHESGQLEEEHMWTFPCMCAAPNGLGKVLEKRTSPCGGTIALHVGDDFALQAYGIKGQFIRLEVNHHYRAKASDRSRA